MDRVIDKQEVTKEVPGAAGGIKRGGVVWKYCGASRRGRGRTSIMGQHIGMRRMRDLVKNRQ